MPSAHSPSTTRRRPRSPLTLVTLLPIRLLLLLPLILFLLPILLLMAPLWWLTHRRPRTRPQQIRPRPPRRPQVQIL